MPPVHRFGYPPRFGYPLVLQVGLIQQLVKTLKTIVSIVVRLDTSRDTV